MTAAYVYVSLPIISLGIEPYTRCLFVVFVTAFVIRIRLAYLNKSKEKILTEMSVQERKEFENDKLIEIDDSDVRYRYVLSWKCRLGSLSLR